MGANGPTHPGLAPTTRITKSARTTNGAFADSNSITFNLAAGQAFFVKAFLIANALFVDEASLPGAADASHTFTASFTAGDVSLLTPFAVASVPPVQVPDPATFGMLLTGLVSLGFARRRRPSHNVAYKK